jgi:hypothetical protein
MGRLLRSLRFRLILLIAAALLPALVAREQAQKTMAARHLLMSLPPRSPGEQRGMRQDSRIRPKASKVEPK